MKLKLIGIVAVVIIIVLIIAAVFSGSSGIIDSGWNDIDDDDSTDGDTAGTYKTNLIIKYADGSQETLTAAKPYLSVSFNDLPITSVGIDIDVKLTGSGLVTQGELEIDHSTMYWEYDGPDQYVYPYDFDGDGDIDSTDSDTLENHHGETGDPGWIIQDLNYDGVINGFDTSGFTTHIGSTNSDTPLDSGQTFTNVYSTHPIFPADDSWHDLFYHEISVSDLDSYDAGVYVIVMQVLATGGSTEVDEFRYRALDASGNAIGDWQTAEMPPPRAIRVSVSDDGTLSIALWDRANPVSTPN
jgi:hypothetical protein